MTHTDRHTPLILSQISPVGWGCGIRRLHLCRGVRSLNECPRYDSKPSDGEASVPELYEI